MIIIEDFVGFHFVLPNLQLLIITNHRLFMKTIIIDPVTRIEGHAKISIYLDDEGQVNDARFHVT